ncbi:RidA family protein [Sulfidibacter corallicola]|uniref:RidA family protein n=1 Tax=Sulfidibacter corallicola TaxID=2818388 RepID=A0A8A4TJL8_SULCO|nr:RidA family protein [Sulfidibacter corallicola]QTD49041.1 RidA family protein [Sulfidibacter corallicola]
MRFFFMMSVISMFFMAGSVPSVFAGEKAATKLPFSSARKAGPTLYVSGQVGRAPDGKKITEDPAAETRQVMENIARILERHGYGFEHVVSATVYLRRIEDYAAMNKVYATYFKGEFPARACIGGQDLVAPYNVEISCIAYKE